MNIDDDSDMKIEIMEELLENENFIKCKNSINYSENSNSSRLSSIDYLLKNSCDEDVKPKVEKVEEEKYSVHGLSNEEIKIKSENFLASTQYSYTDVNVSGCGTGQIKTENGNFCDNVKIEAVKEESPDIVVTSTTKESVKEYQPGTYHLNETDEVITATFRCRICSLIKNERVQIGIKPFHCATCTKIITEEKLFQCKACSETFTSRSSLQLHSKIHTHNAKSFQCQYCFRLFSRCDSFLRHEKSHTKDKPFHCTVCSKSFTNRSLLMRHQRVHTGEKPYRCKFCDKSFSRRSNLTVHERIHTEKKLFHCTVCSESFPSSSTFVNHKRIHAEQNKFRCKFCDEYFDQLCSLTVHLKVHSGEQDPFHRTSV